MLTLEGAYGADAAFVTSCLMRLSHSLSSFCEAAHAEGLYLGWIWFAHAMTAASATCTHAEQKLVAVLVEMVLVVEPIDALLTPSKRPALVCRRKEEEREHQDLLRV